MSCKPQAAPLIGGEDQQAPRLRSRRDADAYLAVPVIGAGRCCTPEAFDCAIGPAEARVAFALCSVCSFLLAVALVIAGIFGAIGTLRRAVVACRQDAIPRSITLTPIPAKEVAKTIL